MNKGKRLPIEDVLKYWESKGKPVDMPQESWDSAIESLKSPSDTMNYPASLLVAGYFQEEYSKKFTMLQYAECAQAYLDKPKDRQDAAAIPFVERELEGLLNALEKGEEYEVQGPSKGFLAQIMWLEE